MKYVALLRGVNVGGKGKVDMTELKAVFERAGMASVKTYINSGNVVFSSDTQDDTRLADILEAAILEELGTAVDVLVRDVHEIESIVGALPADWNNDAASRCDVLFLWDDANDPSVLDELDLDPAIEDVRYTPGAVIRRVDRDKASRSRLTRVVGKPLYRRMTIRNCNTARKLLQLMRD
jgi:uncharacterized protein (DUF1697 family)